MNSKYEKRFIAIANKKFNNKFDYSNNSFIKNKKMFVIKCPIHNDYSQTPNAHLQSKYGCPKCAIEQVAIKKRSNSIVFIKKLIEIYGDKYDYELVNYTTKNGPIILTCKIHNVTFTKSAELLLKNIACRQCGKERYTTQLSHTTEWFINKSKEIHGDKYRYLKTIYVNGKAPLILTCKFHGDFKSIPANHISSTKKSGCPKCMALIGGMKRRLPVETFIEKFIDKHKDNFIIDFSQYNNSTSMLDLTCKKCEVSFNMKACYILKNNILCPKCVGERMSKKFNLGTEKFIEKAINIHGDKYGYELVNYIDYNTDVDIICKKHGVFKQKPNSHLQGSGCKSCKATTGEIKVKEFLILNNINFIEQFKIIEEKNRFRYDFYLPDMNILIEYDGQLHFMSVPFFGGDITLRKQKRIDKLKNNLAHKYGYTLIRVNYKMFNELEKYLKNYLSLHIPYKVNDNYYRNKTLLCANESILFSANNKIFDVFLLKNQLLP